MVLAITASSCSDKKASQLVIENTDIERPHELVVLLKRTVLEKPKQIACRAGKYIILKEGGRPLVVQHDDRDGDGLDEIISSCLYRPAKKVLDIEVSDALLP